MESIVIQEPQESKELRKRNSQKASLQIIKGVLWCIPIVVCFDYYLKHIGEDSSTLFLIMSISVISIVLILISWFIGNLDESVVIDSKQLRFKGYSGQLFKISKIRTVEIVSHPTNEDLHGVQLEFHNGSIGIIWKHSSFDLAQIQEYLTDH